jgi:gliding motility-associated lipoprotein GldH
MCCNRLIIILLSAILLTAGCIPSNTFEKNESITHHRWDKNDPKTYEFDISDTISKYLMFVTFRHTDAYNFSNVWLRVETITPDGKSSKQKVELPLMESTGRWTGKGMNEIYEHKIRVSGNSFTTFDQKGSYKIKLHQIMRENPLKHVLSIGVRLERIPSSQ